MLVEQLMQTKTKVTKIKLVNPQKLPDPIHHTAARTLELVQWTGESMRMQAGDSEKVGRLQSSAADSKTGAWSATFFSKQTHVQV